MSASLAFLVGYAFLMVGVGLWIGRRVRTGGDFFVAGRDLSAGLIFSAFLAANIGAGATIAATSLAYREGLSAWWWNGSAALGSVVLAFLVGPRIWREAKDRGYFTLGDCLERRYDAGVSRLVAAVIWLGTLFILAGQLLGAAAVLSVAGGLPRSAGVILAAVVTGAYFAAGGLLSSAWVNALQVVVTLLGFGIAAPWVVDQAGDWPGLTQAAPAWRADFLYTSGPGSGWTLLIALAKFEAEDPFFKKVLESQRQFAARVVLEALDDAELHAQREGEVLRDDEVPRDSEVHRLERRGDGGQGGARLAGEGKPPGKRGGGGRKRDSGDAE